MKRGRAPGSVVLGPKKKKSAGNHGDHAKGLWRARWLLSEEIIACLPTLACTALYKHNSVLFGPLSQWSCTFFHRSALWMSQPREQEKPWGAEREKNVDLLSGRGIQAERGLVRWSLCSFAFIYPTCLRVHHYKPLILHCTGLSWGCRLELMGLQGSCFHQRAKNSSAGKRLTEVSSWLVYKKFQFEASLWITSSQHQVGRACCLET
jgi:hypothetical protein